MLEWFINLFKKKKRRLRKHSKRSKPRKRRTKPSKRNVHKGHKRIHGARRRPIRVTNQLIDYCRNCGRRRVFRESGIGHWHCSKCGWRDPDDW